MNSHDATLKNDIWRDCISIILDILEDGLFSSNNSSSRKKAKSMYSDTEETVHSKLDVDTRLHTLSSSPPVKRKRSFSDSARDRKARRLAANLANNIARSLTIDDHDHQNISTVLDNPSHDIDMTQSPDMSSPSSSPSLSPEQPPYPSPLPVLGRISLCGAENPTVDLDRWHLLQAQRHCISFTTHINRLNDQKQQLRGLLATLRDAGNDHTKKVDQRFQSIQEHLGRILALADHLCGDHSLMFEEIFPEWMLWESHVNKLAAYVQSVQDMKMLTAETRPRTDDLFRDVNNLQAILDAKVSLYGDKLAQNGLEWKTIGLPVDENLCTNVKKWFINACAGILDEIDKECSNLLSRCLPKASDLARDSVEKLMQSILIGLELTSASVAFTALPSNQLIHRCWILANVYGSWVSEHLEDLNEKQLGLKIEASSSTRGSMHADVRIANKPVRTDMRLLELMETVLRILASLQVMENFSEADHSPDFDALTVLEDFSSTLVEITVRAVALIDTCAHATQKKQSSVMSGPKTATFCMQESVLRFVESVVELAEREDLDGHRIRAMKTCLFLDDLQKRG